MELLQGVSLREELQKTGRLPAPRSMGILHGVTSAVEAAHKRDLIHRDLKPENVFLSTTHNIETPKVLDFGIVKTIGPTGLTHDTASMLGTGPGHLLGTPRYMSPEQLQGDEPSVSWDVWAFAIVAYEMLVGAYPFPLTSPDQWREAVWTGCPTPVRAHWPDGPSEADDLFRNAFSTNPSIRPSSVQRLFDELRSVWA
jgi:serine/threonine-protein kinase